MRFIKNVIALLFLISLTADVVAQELMRYQQPVEFIMPPKMIPTPRKFLISLPKDYDETSNTYPVIFVFDGNEPYLRNLVLSTVDYLTNFSEMPPCIIVNVIQRNRVLDFGPLYAVKNNPSSSKVNGDKFFDFLEQEVMPELSKKFRTQNFKIGIGHSLGGLFLTHSFTKDPEFFNGIIAISPALELKRDDTLFKSLKTTLRSKISHHTFFSWASGTVDINEVTFKPGSIALNKLLAENVNPSFTYKYIDLPGENHNTTPIFSLSRSLAFVFNDWNIARWYKSFFANKTNPEQMYFERRAKMKKLYGFEIDPTEDRIQDNVGSQLIGMKQYAKALPYIEKAIELNNSNGGYYMDLGKIKENLGDYPAAIENMKLGISKLDKTSEDYLFILEDFQKDLKRVEDIMKPK